MVNYECKLCNFKTHLKTDFKRHLNTLKHGRNLEQMKTNPLERAKKSQKRAKKSQKEPKRANFENYKDFFTFFLVFVSINIRKKNILFFKIQKKKSKKTAKNGKKYRFFTKKNVIEFIN